jgi:gluconokinase
MSQTYFLGVDIGTTSTKAIAFSAAGEIKGMGIREYSLLTPQPGWAEQDPELIFQAVIAATREAIDRSGAQKSQVAAIGFSGAMHSLIALDSKGQPLTHSIIWADSRSLAQTERLHQDGTGQALYLRTGTPIHPMSPLTKLLWMRQEAADTFRQAAKFVSIKEYILLLLLDRLVVDYSIASATGLFNLKQLQWDQEALALIGIASDRLSELVPTTQILRGLKPEAAEAMGVDVNTPIVVGASDGVLANLGVGAIDPRQTAITIGTSSAVRSVVPQPITDPKGRTFCYALTADRWVIGGPSNNGGIVLRWFRDSFGQPEVEQANQLGIDPYELLIKAAAAVPAGAEGLVCLPFLSGERAPYWNAAARGIFFGVSLRHRREHFVRSILEGVLFAVYSIALALQDLAGAAQEIRASGGFARSAIWRQMMADVFGYEVLVPEVYEGSGFGAAVLAMFAVGAIDSLDAVQPLIRIGDRHQPDVKRTNTYRQLYEMYDRLYRCNAAEFAQLAAYQQMQP